MISSTIKVVDISVLSDQDLQQLNTASPGTARGGCCFEVSVSSQYLHIFLLDSMQQLDGRNLNGLQYR